MSGYKDTPAVKVVAPSLRGLMADMARYGVVFDADPAPGVNGDQVAAAAKAAADKAAAEKAAADKAAAEAEEAKKKAGTDADAEAARAEAARLKAELDALKAKQVDATPEEIAELRKLKADADKAAADAAAAKKKADEEALKKAGDFEALQARMAEEHRAELKKYQEQIDGLNGQLGGLSSTLVELNIGAAFAGSKFIADETVLTVNKARKIYGDHFELKDGKVVGYDAPKGAEKRVPYVDGQGNPLPFDEVMKRIVEADPDKDSLLRANTKPGAGVVDRGGKPPAREDGDVSGIGRIRLGLPGLLGKK